jgi:hypothetical protein
MPRVPNESQVKWNARAKNDLFEAISEEIFGMSLKRFTLGLIDFVKRSTKCLRKS